MKKSYSDYCNLSVCGARTLSFQTRQKRHSLYMNWNSANQSERISEPSTSSSALYSFGKDDKNYQNLFNLSQNHHSENHIPLNCCCENNRAHHFESSFETDPDFVNNRTDPILLGIKEENERSQESKNRDFTTKTQNVVSFSDDSDISETKRRRRKSSKTVAMLWCLFGSMALLLYLLCVLTVYENLNQNSSTTETPEDT